MTARSSAAGPAVADDRRLRAAIVGLLSFAAAEEAMLLTESPAAGEQGDPRCWAAVPLVAHNTEFKQQQAGRLHAILAGRVPPEFTEIDHASAELYDRYAALDGASVAADSRLATGALIDALTSISADDLLDPARNPWLRGRQLWLQIVVRGFWHPTGHLGEYYLAHGRADRAIALAAHAVATARYLAVPDQAQGMASYNLACAQARAALPGDAARALRAAITLNPDLRANAGRDRDLASLRAAGLLDQEPAGPAAGGRPPGTRAPRPHAPALPDVEP